MTDTGEWTRWGEIENGKMGKLDERRFVLVYEQKSLAPLLVFLRLFIFFLDLSFHFFYLIF